MNNFLLRETDQSVNAYIWKYNTCVHIFFFFMSLSVFLRSASFFYLQFLYRSTLTRDRLWYMYIYISVFNAVIAACKTYDRHFDSSDIRYDSVYTRLSRWQLFLCMCIHYNISSDKLMNCFYFGTISKRPSLVNIYQMERVYTAILIIKQPYLRCTGLL